MAAARVPDSTAALFCRDCDGHGLSLCFSKSMSFPLTSSVSKLLQNSMSERHCRFFYPVLAWSTSMLHAGLYNTVLVGKDLQPCF